MATSRKKLGELLVEARALDPMQLQAALGHQRQWGGRLGAVLVKLGFVTEARLVEVLAAQLRLPVVQLARLRPDPRALSLVPVSLAEQSQLFPVELKGAEKAETLVVAMADPTDINVIDQLQFHTRKRVQAVLAGEQDIARAIRRHYHDDEMPLPSTQAPSHRLEGGIEGITIIDPSDPLGDSHLLGGEGDMVPGLVAWGEGEVRAAPSASAAASGPSAIAPMGVPPGFQYGDPRTTVRGFGAAVQPSPAPQTAALDPFAEFDPPDADPLAGVDLDVAPPADDLGGLPDPLAGVSPDGWGTESEQDDAPLELEEAEPVEELEELDVDVDLDDGLSLESELETQSEAAPAEDAIDAAAEGWLTPTEPTGEIPSSMASELDDGESMETPVEDEIAWEAASETASDAWAEGSEQVWEAAEPAPEAGWDEGAAAWGETPAEEEPAPEAGWDEGAAAWGETPVEAEAPVAEAAPESGWDEGAAAWGETPAEAEPAPEAGWDEGAAAWGETPVEAEAPVAEAAPESGWDEGAAAWGETPAEAEPAPEAGWDEGAAAWGETPAEAAPAEAGWDDGAAAWGEVPAEAAPAEAGWNDDDAAAAWGAPAEVETAAAPEAAWGTESEAWDEAAAEAAPEAGWGDAGAAWEAPAEPEAVEADWAAAAAETESDVADEWSAFELPAEEPAVDELADAEAPPNDWVEPIAMHVDPSIYYPPETTAQAEPAESADASAWAESGWGEAAGLPISPDSIVAIEALEQDADATVAEPVTDDAPAEADAWGVPAEDAPTAEQPPEIETSHDEWFVGAEAPESATPADAPVEGWDHEAQFDESSSWDSPEAAEPPTAEALLNESTWTSDEAPTEAVEEPAAAYEATDETWNAPAPSLSGSEPTLPADEPPAAFGLPSEAAAWAWGSEAPAAEPAAAEDAASADASVEWASGAFDVADEPVETEAPTDVPLETVSANGWAGFDAPLETEAYVDDAEPIEDAAAFAQEPAEEPVAEEVAEREAPAAGDGSSSPTGWAMLGIDHPTADDAVRVVGVLVEMLLVDRVLSVDDLRERLDRARETSSE